MDPVTGACTNQVENYWGRAKKQMKIMQGVPNATLFSHLDEFMCEFMWRELHGKWGQRILSCYQISQQYPTP